MSKEVFTDPKGRILTDLDILRPDKGEAGRGLVATDDTGKIRADLIPAIAIDTIQVVDDQPARLALTNVQVGDMAKQTDTAVTYVLAALPASVNGNWVALTAEFVPLTQKGAASGVATLDASSKLVQDPAFPRVLAMAVFKYDSVTPAYVFYKGYNVTDEANLTHNGAGDHTVTFDVALADANYAVCLVSDGYIGQVPVAGKLAASVQVVFKDDAGVAPAADENYVSVLVIG
jgi:hypothetical protein